MNCLESFLSPTTCELGTFKGMQERPLQAFCYLVTRLAQVHLFAQNSSDFGGGGRASP